jgi:hypothetical protein
MKLDIRRAFWGMILGGVVALAGSLGMIWAIDANNFWVRQGCFALLMLGFVVVLLAFQRGLKSN